MSRINDAAQTKHWPVTRQLPVARTHTDDRDAATAFLQTAAAREA